MFLTIGIEEEQFDGMALIDEHAFVWKKTRNIFGDIGYSMGTGDTLINAFRDPVAEKIIILADDDINTYLREYYFPRHK